MSNYGYGYLCNRRRATNAGLRRHRSRRQQDPEFRFAAGEPVSLGPIVTPENLLRAFEQLQAGGGAAPGPDGVTFRDLSIPEAAAILRVVSWEIEQRTYRPGRPRLVRILKASGGYRTLTIRSIFDRVVSKALATSLTWIIDAALTGTAFGFRPQRSVMGMLAEVEATVAYENRWVLGEDDIKGAFDHVPVGQALEALGRLLPDAGVMWLVETVLRGHQGVRREVGIDQGDPISPMTLNILLDRILDRPLQAAVPDTPVWRYADNIVVAAQTVSEGRRALHEARHLLRSAGFRLRSNGGQAVLQEGEPSASSLVTKTVNLRRQGCRIQVLGFNVSQRNESGLCYEIGEEGWRNLEQRLMKAHDAYDPARVASEAIRGWLQAYGPAFEGAARRDIVERVLRTVSRTGFRGVVENNGLLTVMQEAYCCWNAALERAFLRRSGRDTDNASIPGESSSLSYNDETLRVPGTVGSTQSESAAAGNQVPF